MTANDEHSATIASFTPAQGFGTLRMADGKELTFDASIARVAPADLRAGAQVRIRVGPGRVAGSVRVNALWLEGKAAPPLTPYEQPAPVDDIRVSPQVAFEGLRKAGLLSGLELLAFEALCRKVYLAEQQRLAAEYEDDDEDDGEAADDAEQDGPVRVTEEILLAVLARHYADASAQEFDHVLLVDEDEDTEPAAVAHAKATFERWCGGPLPDESTIEDLAWKAGDALFRANGWGGLLLYGIGGIRADTDRHVDVYMKRVRVHEHVQGLPVGPISTFVSPDEEKRAAGILPRA